MTNSVTYLQNGKLGRAQCLQFGETEAPSLTDLAKKLCNQAVQGIQARWEATIDPILDAYWSLTALCHTNVSFPGTEFTGRPNHRHRRSGENTTPAALPVLTTLTLRNKRALFAAAMIVVALISTFTAGSAIGFAIQGQVAQQQVDEITEKITDMGSIIDILRGNVRPMAILNAVSNLAAHNIATAEVLANSVSRTANYYTGGSTTSSGTREKHLTEAINAVEEYVRRNQSAPVSQDEDI